MIAGFFTNKISAVAAKTALAVGLIFYLICTFIFPIDLHFVHIWGIEFVLNMLVMFGISFFYPNTKTKEENKMALMDLKTWKYTPHLSVILCIVTVVIYISLGTWA